MDTPRRTVLQLLAAAPLVGTSPANAAANASPSREYPLDGTSQVHRREGQPHALFRRRFGEPLVLVHGGQWPSTASADTWAPIFDHLAAKFHVYAVDKLGMGFTDNPKTEADFSMDAITDHTYGFIQAAGIRRAVLVGHSRGALPVARIAADHPDLVSHLVILDSNTLAPPDPNTPERIDPEADREPPSREELKRARFTSNQSVVKDYLTDTYLEAEYRIAHLPKIKEVHARFNAARDKWVRENPELVRQNPL